MDDGLLVGHWPQAPVPQPLINWVATGFGHPFASTLGIAIAPFKKPYFEGTQQAMDNATDDIQQLDRFHAHVPKFMSTPNKRCIGQVLHTGPVSVSSDEPDGFTIDWAVIHLNKDTDDWADFEGNKDYIGTLSSHSSILCCVLITLSRSTSKPTVTSCIPKFPTGLVMRTWRTACSRL